MEAQTIREELEKQEHVFAEDESITFNPDHLTLEEMFPQGVDWDILFRTTAMDLDETPSIELPETTFSLKRMPKNMSRSLWDLLAFDSRYPGDPLMEWEVNTGDPLIRHYLPPQSMWSYDHARANALQRRHTLKKLAIQQLSVAIMVRELLSKLGTEIDFSSSDWNASSPHILERLSPVLRNIISMSSNEHQSSLKKLRRALWRLQQQPGEDLNARNALLQDCRRDHVGIPQYFQDDDGDFHGISRQMNQSIKDILRDPSVPKDRMNLAAAIAKVSHNLLVSSVAPDVHTLNMLILGFKRWNLPEFVDIVVPILEECKIRPNEMTCAAILDHYVRTNRPDRFSSFISRMRGVKNALFLARPDINITEAGSRRLIRVNEEKVYQKVYPTPLVFNSLMLGVLKFAGFDRALEIYDEMKTDGWGLDVLGLSQFLVDCIERRDWQGGLYIWREIGSIKLQAKQSHTAKAYANMLTLCSIMEERKAFNHLLTEIVRCGHNGKEIIQAARSFESTIRSRTNPRARQPADEGVASDVSTYMAEAKQSDSVEHLAEPYSQPASDKTKLDPDDAWALWMLHELGEDITAKRESESVLEKKKEPASVKEESNTTLELIPNRIYMDPDEAWAIWMKQELGVDIREDAKATPENQVNPQATKGS